MLITNSILSENFYNAIQTAYTPHAELNRPAKNRRQQHVRDDPRHTLATYTVSEIETQF